MLRKLTKAAGEVQRNFMNITRARKTLHFIPTTDLLTGLQKTWHWFRENTKG